MIDDDDFSISTRKTQSQNTQSQKTRRAEQKISIGQIKNLKERKKLFKPEKTKKSEFCLYHLICNLYFRYLLINFIP